MPARHYQLLCCACGARFDDDGTQLACPRAHAPALLRSVYREERFVPRTATTIARYAGWLPLAGGIASTARTPVFRSAGLAGALGLRELWIAFSGWWPERGASLVTTTFKELEAITVFGRLDPGERRTLVVASAGNTAAAFAAVATERERPVTIVIPLEAWDALAATVRIGPTVRVVAIAGGAYQDAIALAARLAAQDGHLAEGGVRNVARRDGMGTVVLAAAEGIGALPDAYVQAVGSAAGALAAHEAALRLLADGRYGSRPPRLLLGQNAPFTPIHDAWSRGAATLLDGDPVTARARQSRIGATVLANPAPPYALRGGIREALGASGGSTFAVSNDELAAAMLLFAEREGIDVEPAAGVAIATLAQALRSGAIDPDRSVLLHVTGGGRARRPPVTAPQRPAAILERAELDGAQIERLAASA